MDSYQLQHTVFPAHIRSEDGKIQTVSQHCTEAANYACAALRPISLGETGYLAGLLHDAGKLTGAYKKYLEDAVAGRPVCKGSVNHTFAGVRLILDILCEGASKSARLAAQHIAYAIGAHHGLFDTVDPDGRNGFDHRRTKDDPTIEEGLRNALSLWDTEDLNARLERSGVEVHAFYRQLPGGKEARPFLSHLLVRLLLSAVIEGDRRSTAEFAHSSPFQPISATEELWSDCLSHLEQKLQQFPQETAVQIGRSTFSSRCRDFAAKPGGIYRLNMPTGAGKTLSSMRYALAHAKRWDKKHIFFVMPLLAIIDQNAAVIRDYLGRQDIILEHHSNVLATEEGPELDRRELLAENWDSPVVITTLVQFLNTLFSHKTTAIRRMHSLSDSIIIFDEVQTVPPKLLSLFNQAITFLAYGCNATVILCSATQPALEHAQRPLACIPEDMVPYEEALWEPFRRTTIQPTQAMDLEKIAAFASQQLADVNSLLIVCNKKSQAEQLFHLLQKEDAACFHLSASMCMAHRRDVLAAMEQAKAHSKVLCVSTQVMEAGIDASFGCVIRLQAGMDSVVQAAGRCNRHGESETPVPVYVIRCKGENLHLLKDLELGKDATEELICTTHEELSCAKAIEQYYRIFYRDQKAKIGQDYRCKLLDAKLYDLLGENRKYVRQQPTYFLNQAFKTACTHFQVFDQDTVDVVVPYGDGAAEIAQLRNDPTYLFEHSQRLKPYTISLYTHQRKALDEQGALSLVHGSVLVLEPHWYDAYLGLQVRREMAFLEV